MGQQQFLLLCLGVIVVGIAIFVGIQLFAADSTESNKDGVTNSLLSVAADAYHFKLRPTTLGGGRPGYAGYTIPQKMQSDDFGRYAITGTPSDIEIKFTGISAFNSAWVATCTVDSSGKTSFIYNGWL
jgi:hypothetical protein